MCVHGGCCGCVHTQYAWVCVCVFRGIGMCMCVCVHMCVSFWGCTYVCVYAARVCDVVFDIVCVFVSRRGDSEVLSN